MGVLVQREPVCPLPRMAVGMDVDWTPVVSVHMEMNALAADAADHVHSEQNQHAADTEFERPVELW